MIPGWRMGWIVIHDKNGTLSPQIRSGLQSLSQRIIGSSTILQGALNSILNYTPPEFFRATIDQVHVTATSKFIEQFRIMNFNTYLHFPFIFSVLQHHAQLAYRLLADVAGLRPIMPAGAMYMMVKLLSLSQLFGLLMGPSNVIKVGMDMTKFPGFESDLQFVEQMVTEQSVFCLPGRVRIPNGFIATLFISSVLLFFFRSASTIPITSALS